VAEQRIGVVGGTPTWRRGVTAVLADAGYRAAEHAGLNEWRPGRSGRALLLHVTAASDLVPLSEFTEAHPHIPVIVVAPELGVAEFAASVRAGAISAISADEPVELLLAVLEHAIAGRASAAPSVIRALSMRIAAGFGEALSIDADSVALIRNLAAGTTVSQLASEVGFSEREMFRLLGELYVRIGVANRTEAIVWASRHGLLDEPGTPA